MAKVTRLKDVREDKNRALKIVEKVILSVLLKYGVIVKPEEKKR